MFNVIQNAWADTASGAATVAPDLLVFITLLAAFYFFMIRPQGKKAKAHQDMLSELKKGDEVCTSGGLVGTIHKLGDQHVALTVHDTTQIIVQKQAITQVLPKGTLKTLP